MSDAGEEDDKLQLKEEESTEESEDEGDDNLADLTTEKRLEVAKADVKRIFEEERDEVLKSIPAEYSNMMGQIGFTKWGRNTLPILILNPFHVPPGKVREQWMTMYKTVRSSQQIRRDPNVNTVFVRSELTPTSPRFPFFQTKEKGRLNYMTYLIYWYGTVKQTEFYYFLPQKQFIPYEKEAAKPEGAVMKLQAALQKKVDGQVPMTKKEQDTFRAYKELEEDLLKDPADRRRGVVDFPEGYDMLSEKDLFTDDQDDLEDDEPPKKKARRQSYKKSKKAEEEPAMKPKRSRRPSKKTEKGKKAKVAAAEDSVDVKAPETVDSEGIGDEEDDSGKDEAFINEELSSHDEQDDEYFLTTKLSKGSKVGAKGRGKTAKARKGAKPKETVVKKKQKAKHKVEGPLSDKQTRRREQKAFKECEENYLPLIRKWKSALRSSDTKQVQCLIIEADKVIRHFSASFLVEYDLSGIVKETKVLLKRTSGDLTALNALRVKLRETYLAKEALVPKGFKPKKTVVDPATKQGSEETGDVGARQERSKDFVCVP